jgi:hypothetical protein
VELHWGIKRGYTKSINQFKPKILNKAFNVALEIKDAINPVDKRVEFIKSTPAIPTKAHLYLTYKNTKPIKTNDKPNK